MPFPLRSNVPFGDLPVHFPECARPAFLAADLGFGAFIERNQPRYARYAAIRLDRQESVPGVVYATLSFAHVHWDWLLSRRSLAADVWEELRLQVGRCAGTVSAQDADVATLYQSLPETGADSVLLCHSLGLDVPEAAELMGLEPPAVEAALGAARRSLPHVLGKRTLLMRP
ncbi:hypothetical protein [Streptomyces sp. NPDC058155]|uniref:hypothetical protein n=1 Tax=Streptomyces sp. NPDC058155 TaxID=3346359 RepID=UPI0036E91EFF